MQTPTRNTGTDGSSRLNGWMRRGLLAIAWQRAGQVDAGVIGVLRRVSVPLLRVSLGLVFVWFGLLKVFEVSPVSELVASTVYWFDASWVVPALGVVEVFVGTCLLLGRLMRLTLLLFALQMVGTFLVLVVQPDIAFQRGNPLLLTVEGEFVVKNLVLLSAGMVVGSSVTPLRQRAP